MTPTNLGDPYWSISEICLKGSAHEIRHQHRRGVNHSPDLEVIIPANET
jgi:hypothetical protein